MSYGDSEAKMNLSALQRVDPYVDSIVQTAGHVALYSFNAEANAWQKTNVEGTLHVYTRSAEPLHSIMIMNRLNTNNLMEPIENGLDLQLQEPFLLYRNCGGSIYGIWFYDKEECAKISNILKSLIKSLIVKQNDKINKQETGSTKSIDLVSMLSRAQEDYRANKTSSKGSETPSKKVEETAPPQCVMDFFAQAGSGKNFSEGLPSLSSYANTQSTQTPALKTGSNESMLHKLMASPIHTVEQIEMQQRSATPRTDILVATHTEQTKTCSFNNIKPRSLINQLNQQDEDDISHANRNGYHRPKDIKNNSFSTSLIDNFLNQSDLSEKSNIVMGACMPLESQLDSDELMPPTRFILDDIEDELVTSSVNAMSITEPKHRESTSNKSNNKLEPLTKNQLLQAFEYLLKNDPDFMVKIHEGYVKSLLRN